MKIPITWLAEYVDIKGLSLREVSEGLRFSGTENLLEESQSFKGVVVGEIKEINPHPNADKLKIAQVAIGPKKEANKKKLDEDTMTIVCGATNIKVGQKVPVALVGARLGDFKISKVKIRGIESNGMLCSEKELGIGDDHAGILILKKEAKVGVSLSSYLGAEEAVLNAEITPNRGDCLSVIGIAQEVAATFKRKLKLPKFKKVEIDSKKKIKVEVLEKELCPRYIAKVIEGVKIEPSPDWIQQRLLLAGIRPISNVVDVTNYVMLEWGQPLHAFDYDKLPTTGSQLSEKKIVVRKAKKGEKIETLDGIKRDLTTDDLVIADSKKPIAIAGVMGGANTEVDNKTKTIILEAAVFDGESVRRTAKRQNNRTEASNRFEKGVPLQLSEIAIERAAELLCAAGVKKGVKTIRVGENADILSSWIWIQHIGLRLSTIKKVLGLEIAEEKVTEILKDLGFSPERFDFRKEARKHIGKPYVFGAKYKTHGDMAFDCSYLTDYIYSLIGKFIGYTSLAQYELGQPIDDAELQPGDILFLKGHIDKSVTDSYFVPENHSGYKKILLNEPKEVGHNALYIGDGRIIHARHYEYDVKAKNWKKLPKEKAKVIEENAEVFLDNPEYLGARRYLKNPNEFIAATAPWWRLDTKIEEDLLEEIARIYGYEKIPSRLPAGLLPTPKINKDLKFKDSVREKLQAVGYSEVITYSFVPKDFIKLTNSKNEIKIMNPISKEQEYMRNNLVASLLEVVAKNQANYETIKIFEIARVYGREQETTKIALSVKMPTKDRTAIFAEIKGATELLVKELTSFRIHVKEINEHGFFEKGQAAEIILNKKPIGHLGIIAKKISSQFDLKSTVAVAEISFNDLLNNPGQKMAYQTLSKYPRVRRDINMVFSREVKAQKIMDNLNALKAEYLLNSQIVDIYQDQVKAKKQLLPEGKKSVTIRLIIGSNEGTLTEEEIKKTEDLVIGRLSSIGGAPRI